MEDNIDPITVTFTVYGRSDDVTQLTEQTKDNFIKRHRDDIAKRIETDYHFDCYKEFLQMPDDALKEYLDFDIQNGQRQLIGHSYNVPVIFDYPRFREFVYECKGMPLPEEEPEEER